MRGLPVTVQQKAELLQLKNLFSICVLQEEKNMLILSGYALWGILAFQYSKTFMRHK